LTLKGTVTEVVDGATIKVVLRGFETPVRLIVIDTPETKSATKPIQCFGPKAAARTTALLPVGQGVRLLTDATQATRDRDGRRWPTSTSPAAGGRPGSVSFSLI
jgi:micrococcal nuclease